MTRISLYHVELVKDSSHNYNVSRDMSSPYNVIHLLVNTLHLDKRNVENFGMVAVNTQNKLIAVQILTQGSIDTSIASTREVFQCALLHNARAIILFHNHPSGNSGPSKEDIAITKRIVKAGELLGIPVLDHVIVGSENDYFSMRSEGIIND